MPALIQTEPKPCGSCGFLFERGRLKGGRIEDINDWLSRRFCSKKCWGISITGEGHYNWRGGTKTRPDGYIRDSRTDRYIHRIVVERELGRPLLSSEHVHHINGNKKDNRPDNLTILSNSEHRKLETSVAKRGKNGRFEK